jgi:hypothetical protein
MGSGDPPPHPPCLVGSRRQVTATVTAPAAASLARLPVVRYSPVSFFKQLF